MQANYQKWVQETNQMLKELLEAKSDLAKVEKALDLSKQVLSLVTNEATLSSEDIIGEHFMDLPNAERFDSWFQNHPDFAGPKSTFEILDGNTPKLQAKLYWLKKRSNALMAGAVHFTPNWEDGTSTRNDNRKVGIDFFLSPDAKSLHVALSNFGKLRVLELSARLTNTDIEVLEKWHNLASTNNLQLLHTTIWDSFKLQSVNSRFYNGVADAFTELHDHLVAQGKPEQEAKMFASRLLGRLIFIWFIRKMNLVSSSVSYFDPSTKDQGQYYRESLERLFFRTLNQPVPERVREINGTLDIETPYLNGGLFSPRADDWVGEEISFPEEFFTRLFDHFSDFNFTTDESTPEYEQVAIDPEMLGRVFESLLASQVEETGEQARKAKGTFYTPREIVSFMCKEALRSQLASIDPYDNRIHTAIEKLVDTSDQAWTTASSNSLRDIPSDLRLKFSEALRSLRTLDPACGSGAFPLGMLQLLTKMQLRLDPKLNEYQVKLSILQNNIFGSDIEPMAVEISRLRSWLSLIVEEKNVALIEPLPNLDFNFVCANSLISLRSEDLFSNANLQEQLDELRKKYFRAKSPSIKKQIQDKYMTLTQPDLFDELDERGNQLKTFNPFDPEKTASFFDPNTMFGLDRFDIVIGNPPYVRQEKISYKSELKDYKIFTSTADLYTYFYEMALKNLKPTGTVSFITSSKFARALYGQKLRNLLKTKTQITQIVDFGTKHLFSAITNTWVLVAENQVPGDQNEFGLRTSVESPPMKFAQSNLNPEGWSFPTEAVAQVISNLKKTKDTLSSLGYVIYRGILTGCNEAFVIDQETKEDLIQRDPKNQAIIRPLLRGRDIGQYEIKKIEKWLLTTKNGIDIQTEYPTIADYLRSKNAALEGKVEVRGDKGSHWMNLRDCSYYDAMENQKIVWLELSDLNKFALSSNGEYILNGAWMLQGPNLLEALVILNSKLIRTYVETVANSSGMGTTQWRKYIVEEIPFPDLKKVDSKVREKLAWCAEQKISASTPHGAVISGELDNVIEHTVAQAYGIEIDSNS